MIARERKVVLVTRRTPLEDLITRYHTLDQVRFYLHRLGQDITDYEQEHEAYMKAKVLVLAILQKWGRFQVLERAFLPNFLFGSDDIVMALGQDGLIANTMKYLTVQPLIGINPDPSRYDGVLLPFVSFDMEKILPDVAFNKRHCQEITMAKVSLTDGQTLYAVNDFFIGCKSHVSARYELAIDGQQETQSSSGIIVATGLGSTGWMRSIETGAVAIAKMLDSQGNDSQSKQVNGGIKIKSTTRSATPRKLAWDSNTLQFAVREPFPSQHSQTNIVAGFIEDQRLLEITSQMPENGVIFSDGIENDFLDFTAGLVAKVGVANRKGLLVI